MTANCSCACCVAHRAEVAASGRLGGVKRAKSMSKAMRVEAARKAANARWAKREVRT